MFQEVALLKDEPPAMSLSLSYFAKKSRQHVSAFMYRTERDKLLETCICNGSKRSLCKNIYPERLNANQCHTSQIFICKEN